MQWGSANRFLCILPSRVFDKLINTRSSIINNLREFCQHHQSTLLWFYCDGRSGNRKTQRRILFGSIYRQLIENAFAISTDPAGIVDHLENFRKQERDVPDSMISRFFVKNLANQCTHLNHLRTIYVLIDGIDESQHAQELSIALTWLADNCERVKALVTCRPEQEIEEVFNGRPVPRIDITETLISNDLQIHIDRTLELDEKFRRVRVETKTRIRENLLQHHGGM